MVRLAAHFCPGKAGFHPVRPGWLPSESCFRGRLHLIRAAGHAPKMPSSSQVSYNLAMKAKSGFRFGPGAYSLPYSPRAAGTAIKPPQ
jgi:hypothetical protein